MSNTSQINTSAQQGEPNTKMMEHPQVQYVSLTHQANAVTSFKVLTIRPVTTTVTRRIDASPPPKEQDPFLFFSNQDRRMAYLVRNVEEQVEDDVVSNRIVESATAMVEEERRQRITFEVHPELMYMEELSSEGCNLD